MWHVRLRTIHLHLEWNKTQNVRFLFVFSLESNVVYVHRTHTKSQFFFRGKFANGKATERKCAYIVLRKLWIKNAQIIHKFIVCKMRWWEINVEKVVGIICSQRFFLSWNKGEKKTPTHSMNVKCIFKNVWY